MAGASAPFVVKLNLEKRKIVSYKRIQSRIDGAFYFRKIKYSNGMLYAPEPLGNKVYIFDCEGLNIVDTLELPYINKGIADLVIHADKIWFIPRYDEAIVKWEIETDIFVKIDNWPKDFKFGKDDKREMDFPIIVDDKIYLFPVDASDVICINTNTDEISVEYLLNTVLNNVSKANVNMLPKVIFAQCEDRIIKILRGYDNRIISYNLLTSEISILENNFDDREIDYCEKSRMKDLFINEVVESDEITLNSYIKYLK